MTDKAFELCNDIGVTVEVRDSEACHRLFKKKLSVTQKDYGKVCHLDPLNISSTLDFSKLAFPMGCPNLLQR